MPRTARAVPRRLPVTLERPTEAGRALLER